MLLKENCTDTCHYLGIQRSFEKALYSYDYEAAIQLQASHYLINSLAQVNPSPQKVLDLGCGSGLITRQLCKKLQISFLHINDLSPIFLEKACYHLQEFHPKSILFNFDKPWGYQDLYDLIFSNMAFQWSFNIQGLFKKCYNHLKQSGLLAFSLPLKGSFFELEPHQRISFYSFDYISQSLAKEGFTTLKAYQLLLGRDFKTHLQALKSIKKCGANYVPHTRSYRMMERSKLSLPSTLTYAIGIFIVSK
ncbi:MAG: methyltransferase [Proteobacteria bacterium]|nr:methyltransferase [Pseudomonadota bacterium]